MKRADVSSAERKSQESGINCVIALLRYCVIGFGVIAFCMFSCAVSFGEEVKQPNVSGQFYPADPQVLSKTLEGLLSEAKSEEIKGNILVLISPHAGYEFSGRTAASGYNTIKGRDYDTVILLGPSHFVGFKGAALWPKGAFRTPLGEIPVDESVSYSLMLSSPVFFSYPEAFSREHSIEVQLPFLQKILGEFKIVPIILGQIDFYDCQHISAVISKVIKEKKCLLIASTDMYHGFNYKEGELIDIYTLSLIKKLNSQQLYESIQAKEALLCGWAAVTVSMLVAEDLGYKQVKVIDYTNSAKVTGRDKVGEYCVGYSSVVMYKGQSPSELALNEAKGTVPKIGRKGGVMLNQKQRRRLLEIARNSIETYLKTGKKLELSESEPALLEHCGAFVTLRKNNQLRGCIGNIIGNQPLYLTVRDMAVEAAVNDPRFTPVTEEELPEIEIEISVLSPLKQIEDPDEIKMGQHGVLVRKGYRSGVFLPQVATETGWTKEEFLSNLCAHKAGLSPSEWKDPSTEVYIFTAEVFSEKNY